MLILTPERAAKRQQAREVFPNAEWLPGDEPPCGTRVLRSNGQVATVLGSYTGPEPTFEDWWLLDCGYQGEHVGHAPALDWPPTLRRAP